MRIRPISRVLRRAAAALAAVAVAVPLIAARADAFIYWSLNPGAGGGLIGKANNTGQVVNPALLSQLFGAQAVAVDGKYLYWANGSDKIGRANLDGSSANPNFIVGSFSANAIAVDPVGGYIFWADLFHTQIGRATLGTTATDVQLAFVPSLNTNATALTVVNKVLYWTTYLGPGGGSIGRVNEDGSSPQRQWVYGLSGAQGITNDGTYLYWVNGANQIGRMQLDGTDQQPFFLAGPRVGTALGSNTKIPSPIVAFGGDLYFANLFDGYIGRVAATANATPNNRYVTILGSATGLAVDSGASPGPLPPSTLPEVDELRADVQVIGLAKGIERSLLAKVEAFSRAVDSGDQASACDSLTAYANQVDALSGKKIPLAPAAGLLADIQSFRTTLGCTTG